LRASSASGRAAAIAALLGAAVIVTVLLLGGDDSYRVTARFENASQLVTGNEVAIGGTGVGQVEEIELGDDGEALVTFSVDEEFTPLRRGTTATIRTLSLAGVAGRQVQLTPPPDGEAGPEIEDGGTLTQAETVSAVDLDQIFNMLDDETVADLKRVIRGFEVSYAGVGPQANRGFRYLNPLLSTSRRLFAELTRDERAFEQLIVDGAQLTGALAERRDDLSALVGDLNSMMGAIGRQKTSLARAVRGLPAFMRSFNTTAVNLRSTLDEVDPLVGAAKPVARRLRPFFGEFRAAAADLVPTIRDLDAVIERPGSADDLVELVRLQRPLRRIAVGPVRRNGAKRPGAFPEAGRALTDSLRPLSFLRAYAPELVGWFDGFGHSGVVDANGGLGRIGTTFNTFPFSTPGVPKVDLSGYPFGAQSPATQRSLLDTGNLRRCPGSNERPAPDGSNPFTEGGTLDCNPNQIPPGP
jgi:phospholipid/cholesterol/gamma-HCH transport system substrate-binding protein